MRHQPLSFGVLLLILSLSGCLALPIYALQGVNMYRTSGGEVGMEPFENTKMERDRIKETKHLAISPFEGDYRSTASTFADMLQENTDLKIISPHEVSTHGNLQAAHFLMPGSHLTTHDQIRIARTIGDELEVDGILFGRVVPETIETGYSRMFIGGKQETPERLYLSLVSVSQEKVIWEDELPFVVYTGTHHPSNEEISTGISQRLLKRFAEIGLIEGNSIPEDSEEESTSL